MGGCPSKAARRYRAPGCSLRTVRSAPAAALPRPTIPNPLHTIPNHAFHGLHGLKTLIINNMPLLESVEALAFHDLHYLETLEIQNNVKLNYIHPKAFRDHLLQVSIR